MAPLLDRELLLFPAAMVRRLQRAPMASLVARPILPAVVVAEEALTMRAPATRVALVGSLVAVAEAAARPAAPAVRVGLGLTAK